MPTAPLTMSPDTADYMTCEEASNVLGVHLVTIYKMVKSGKLESYKFGHSVMIKRASVIAFNNETKGMAKNDPRRGRNAA